MEYSRTATWDDLFYIINLLKEYKVDFILVGGYAVNYPSAKDG
jgi:DNA repair exonuclease SbcCD nuclease subunit